MKNIYLLSLFVLPFVSMSQSTEVEIWKSSHPQVLYLEDSDVSEALIERLEENNAAYIIYSEELTIDDIKRFDLNNHLEARISNQSIDVKEWLDKHENIKIVKRSFFDDLSSEERLAYLQPNILILNGESLTLMDIQEFNPQGIDPITSSDGQ